MTTDSTFKTGRLKRPVTSTARRILFDEAVVTSVTELEFISHVDFAHILMLAECGIVEEASAQRLLKAIDKLRAERFEPLGHKLRHRGLFLLYEAYLIDTEGAAVGGILQTARSRNDLNATVLRLRLRDPFLGLIRSLLRLQAVLIRRAERFAGTVMPAYTHGQVAEPITYGHYLSGAANALCRDIGSLIEASKEIDVCPLGAAAVAGTAFPIDCGRTAELLGFLHPALNSLDAVASRDLILRVLAATAILGVTMSRVATDLMQWTTAEFDFLELPDEVVGSSSAMPQKRNPFLLEHVQGRTSAALGALVTSVAACRNVPFSNSICVATEAVRPLWTALQDTSDAAVLLRLVVAGAAPNPQRMVRRVSEGFGNASAAATQLVLRQGLDFRSAHRRVGEAVSMAVGRGFPSLEALIADDPRALDVSAGDLDPANIVRQARYGGGPSSEVRPKLTARLRDLWSHDGQTVSALACRWAGARQRLAESVREFCRAGYYNKPSRKGDAP